MKEVKYYVCEMCGLRYTKKEEAQKCEKLHFTPVEIANCQYNHPDQAGGKYPARIDIKMSNGNIVVYRLRGG